MTPGVPSFSFLFYSSIARWLGEGKKEENKLSANRNREYNDRYLFSLPDSSITQLNFCMLEKKTTTPQNVFTNSYIRKRKKTKILSVIERD